MYRHWETWQKKVLSPNQERFPAYLGLTCQQSGNLTMEEVVLYQKIFHLLNSNTDTGNDVMPPPYPNVIQPIHQVGIVAMGLWILDNANLDDLAKECQKRNKWEFSLNIGPLKLTNTTGSPVNPIAIFWQNWAIWICIRYLIPEIFFKMSLDTY